MSSNRSDPARRRIRRRGALLLLVFVALAALLAFSPLSTAQAVSYSAEEVAFAKLLNDYRASNGLEPLLVSDALSEAGDRHCSDMGKYNFFSHTTAASDWFPVGATPWDRMAASGYTYRTAKGENIAAGYSTAAAAFTGWKNSPGHNANMLSDKFKVVGVSLVSVSGSRYGSYWTTGFGGYVDPTARSLGSTQPTSTTTTARPVTTTTTVRVPTTLAPVTTVPPTSTTSTTSPAAGSRFSDVSRSTPYASAIELLAKRNIISGFPDGSFRPERTVTRQQIAKMVALTMGYPLSLKVTTAFIDVAGGLDAGDPFYPRAYIAACVAHGVVLGKTPTLFAPYDPVLRAQAITMVARAAQLPAPRAGYLPPFPNFSADHYPWATKAAAAGLLDGLLGMGRHYNFWADASRAEVCEILAGLLR